MSGSSPRRSPLCALMILWWLCAGVVLLVPAPPRDLSARQPESDLQVSQQAESDLFEDRNARLKDARSAYERGLQLAPGLDEARLRLACVYGEMKQPEQAINALQIVVRETSSDWIRYLAQLFRGRSCEALDRVEEAVEHYRQAARICPECQVPRVALSNAHRKAGDREEATTAAASVADIRAATVVDPWQEYYLGQAHRVRPMLLELRREVGNPPR